MKSPGRDGGGELPEGARDLLRRSAKPVPPTAAERAAITAMAARIAAAPLPPGSGSPLSKLAALGGGKVAGVVALTLIVGGATWFGVTRLGAGSPERGAPPASATAAASVPAGPGVAEPPANIESPPSANIQSPPSASGDKDASPDSASPTLPLDSAPVKSAPPRSPLSTTSPKSPVTVAVSSRSNPITNNSHSKPVAVAVAPAVAVAVPVAAAPSPSPTPPPAPAAACPVTGAPGDRSSEGPILSAAAKALSATPLVTLSCVESLTKIGGPFQLRDEHAFLGFEASRRLGREADARRYAQALLKSSPGSAYAAKARAYLAR